MGHLAISAEARNFILRTRPELAGAFQVDGCIAIDNLLTPAANPPSGPFPPSPSQNPEFATRSSRPTVRLGDTLAALLHRFRIDALVALLQRGGLLGDCQCAARQARLNALGLRLRAQLEPWPLTLAVLLSWLLLALVFLVR